MATRHYYNLVDAPDEVIVGSFRYYLGRKTYAVSSYCSWLRNSLRIIDDSILNLMEKEIQEAISAGSAGMSCDEEEWACTLRGIYLEKLNRSAENNKENPQ